MIRKKVSTHQEGVELLWEGRGDAHQFVDGGGVEGQRADGVLGEGKYHIIVFQSITF